MRRGAWQVCTLLVGVTGGLQSVHQPSRKPPARHIGQTGLQRTEVLMGQTTRRPLTRGEVRGEIPTSARASAHVLPAALRRTSPLALVSGGPAVWRGSCYGEVLHRLDGPRWCSILVMMGLGRRACHEATFRALPRWIPRSATRGGNRCTVAVVIACCARHHARSGKTSIHLRRWWWDGVVSICMFSGAVAGCSGDGDH